MDSDRLAGVPLFSGLSSDERARVAGSIVQVTAEPGETLCTEGEFAYQFFVIEEGTADVTTNGTRIAALGAGDFFGEVGLLVTGRRSASVVATSPMRVLAMFDQSFRQLERDEPGVARWIEAPLSERPWLPLQALARLAV